MIFWVAKQIILSVVLIAVIHYIYTFFKNNLTTPQIRDLIKKPQRQYDDIYKKISNKKKDGNDNMKSELKKYLAEIKKKPGESDREILGSGANTFGSNFEPAYQNI